MKRRTLRERPGYGVQAMQWWTDEDWDRFEAELRRLRAVGMTGEYAFMDAVTHTNATSPAWEAAE